MPNDTWLQRWTRTQPAPSDATRVQPRPKGPQRPTLAEITAALPPTPSIGGVGPAQYDRQRLARGLAAGDEKKANREMLASALLGVVGSTVNPEEGEAAAAEREAQAEAEAARARSGTRPTTYVPKLLYHGTRSPALPTSFRPVSESVNGSTFSDLPTTRHGVFLTDNADFAKEYGPTVGQYRVSAPKVANLDPGPGGDPSELHDQFVRSLDPHGPDRELWQLARHTKQPWQLFENELGARFSKFLQSKGFHGAHFYEETPNAAAEGRTTVVFDPSRISPADAPSSAPPAARNGTGTTPFRQVQPEDFHAALGAFAEAKPDEAPFHTMRTPEQMRAERMSTFLSPDGRAGYAMAPLGDGRHDIRNVFNTDAGNGAGAHALADAVARGGNVLDHFDTGLGNFYRDFGFKEYAPKDGAARYPWSDEYRPEGWNEARYGRPDVVNQMHPLAGRASREDLLARYEAARAARKTGEPSGLAPVRGGALPDPARSIDGITEQLAKRNANRERAYQRTTVEAPFIRRPSEWQRTDRGVFPKDQLDYSEPAELPFTPRSSPQFSGLHPLIDRIATDPKVERVLQGDVEKGLRMGGLTWYSSLKPVRDFYDALGNRQGFHDFNAAGAAGSAQTPTHNELNNSSLLIYAKENGITPQEAKAHFLEKYGDPLGLPGPYFLDGEKGSAHIVPFQRYQQRGWFGPEDLTSGSLKTPSYAHNRNLGATGVPLDAHEKMRLSQATGVDRDVLSKLIDANATNYLAATQPYRRIGQKLGLNPDQVQASRWLGGGLLTGLQSQPQGDFLQTIEDGLLHTARLQGRGERPQDLRNLWGEIAAGKNFFFPFAGDGGFPVYK